MVIGKIKPTATIVAQFAAGVEIEAIQHDGKMYLPVVGMGEFSTKEEAPVKVKVKDTSVPAKETPTKESPAPKSSKTKAAYTEEALMEMSTKDLSKICTDEFGIDPDEYEGKNTNKKLRNLILDAQENGGAKADEDEDDDAEESKDAESEEQEEESLTDQVAGLLEDFDAGKKNKKKTISAICALADDVDTDAVSELVDKFEDDADADLDEIAEEIVNVLNGEKKSKKKRAKKSKDENLVSPEDLEVGDRVSVWWDDDNQEWYDGEVKSIKKGKITIAYDDDTEEVIDPEVHTKIKRLSE